MSVCMSVCLYVFMSVQISMSRHFSISMPHSTHLMQNVSCAASAVVLFNAVALGHRLFVDDFFLHSELVGNMMLELYDSVLVYSNTESLRSKYILNPSNDGDSMTHPVKSPVRHEGSLSAVKSLGCCCC